MPDITKFETGAIRDAQDGKEDYVETISFTALRRYAEYMTGKKKKYGQGNFKKGIPIESYEASLMRHVQKYYANKYENQGLEPNEDHLAACVFNIFGIMHEEGRWVDEGLGYIGPEKKDTSVCEYGADPLRCIKASHQHTL